MISIQCKGYSLRITGHAGYAPEGQDIVCAAASILVYTAAETVLSYAVGGMLLRAESEGLLRAEPVVDMQPGDITIACAPKHERVVRAMWDTALLGMQMVAHEYPQNVRFERE